MGARAAGMAYASSALYDEWSLFNNPGGLAKMSQNSAAFAYDAPIRLKGANRTAALYNHHTKPGTASFGLFRFGDDVYNEQTLSIGFGNQIGISSLGLKLNILQYHSQGLGIYRAVTFEFGGITKLSEVFHIGAHITNLTQAKIGKDNEPLPVRLTTGMSYQPDKDIIITSELCKVLEYPITWRTGIEYGYHQKVFIRTGFNLNPGTGFFGIGIRKKIIRMDYSLQFNHYTGPSHQAAASYWFLSKEKK